MMHMNNKRAPSPLYGTQCVPPRYNKPPSKVVSIPVHFVGSDRSRSESATKIQRVAKGFLVRKSVKKMVALKVELEEIVKNVNASETVELIKKEQKERVRIGERIMNLLLKLDSVRVFHCSTLRDLRKFLIKRAIVLQEFVDQIQMVGPTTPTHQIECVGVIEEENCLKNEEVGCEEEHEGGKKMEALMNEEKDDGEGKCVDEEKNCLVDEERDCLVKEVGCEEEHGGGNKIEALMNEEKEDGEGNCLVDEEKNCLVNEEEKGEDEEHEDGEGECVGESLVEEDCEAKEEESGIGCEEEEEENCKGGSGRGDDGGNRELLKRMMEDNEKMMGMMAQLFERNEMQTRYLTSLTQRVEQLERAFTFDRMRRKNKKRRNVDAKHTKNGCT